MAKTKISTLAKELNLALPTVFSFLRDKGISIEESPNTRVEDNVVELLVSNFKSDKDKRTNPPVPPRLSVVRLPTPLQQLKLLMPTMLV